MEIKIKNESNSLPMVKSQELCPKNEALEEAEKEQKFFESAINRRKSIVQDEEFISRISHDILDEINDGLIYLSRTGIILDVNKKAVQFFGGPKEEFLGKHFTKIGIFTVPDSAWLLKSFKAALSQKVNLVEVKIRNKKGKELYLECSVTVVKRGRFPSGLIIIARDITQQKLAEISLKNSEEKLKILFDYAPDAYYLNDLKGNFIDGNKKAEKLTGYKREELIGKNFLKLKLLSRRNLPKAAAALVKNALGQPTGPDEFVLNRKDGSQVMVEISTYPVKIKGQSSLVLGIARDITERNKAQEDRVLLTSAIEQVEEVIAITDIDSRIKYVNPALEKITGFTNKEVRGQSLRLFLKNGGTDLWQKIRKAMTKGEAWTGRLSLRKKDSSLFEAEVTASPVRNNRGKVTNCIYVLRDITDEVKWEEQLRQVQKMEALGTLTGGIAHDFNNILTSIIGYTEMALDDAPPGSLLRSNLEEVFKAGKRGQDLVNQILTFSRPSRQEKKPVLVSSLVKEVLKLLRVSLPANVKIHQNMKSESMVMADPTQIHQIVINLCKNAADAMNPKGGLLEVSLEDVELSSNFLKAYPNLQPGPFLKLSVKDTGCGIEESVLNRIFDPFFTTKEPGQGTGMGLAVVHSVVRNHGGIINVHSQPGEGTTFDVFLPRSREITAAKDEKLQSVPGGRERLLFIDDEEQVVKLGKQVLESLGYQVAAFTNPLKALQTFKARPENFDLVLADSIMPGMAGSDLAAEILEIRPEIPLIFCTGNGLQMTKEKAMEIGAQDLIAKPFLKKDVAQTVRKVLDQAKSRRRG